MQRTAPVCCPHPRRPEHDRTMSTGAPSPSRTPPASPGSVAPDASTPAQDQAAVKASAPPARKQPGGRPRWCGLADAGGWRRERWATSPSLAGRELAWAALAGVALALITTWPLVLHLPSRIAPDLGDPIRTAWQVGWVGHAMLHDPLHMFDANVFYPHPLSLAFSDSLLGYGPAAFFGSATVAALVRYHLLFLFAW